MTGEDIPYTPPKQQEEHHPKIIGGSMKYIGIIPFLYVAYYYISAYLAYSDKSFEETIALIAVLLFLWATFTGIKGKSIGIIIIVGFLCFIGCNLIYHIFLKWGLIGILGLVAYLYFLKATHNK